MARKRVDVRRSGLAIAGPDRVDLRLAISRDVRLAEHAGVACLEFGDPFGTGRADAESPPLSGCLDAFLRLEGASDMAFRDFAAQWGRLGLCWHQLPFRHAPRCWSPEPELLETWRFYVKKFGAARRVGAALTGELGVARDDDWRDMHEWPDPLTRGQLEALLGAEVPDHFLRGSVCARRLLPRLWSERQLGSSASALNLQALAATLSAWLDEAGVQPAVVVVPRSQNPTGLEWVLGAQSLLQALVTQLADELLHFGLYECTNCHQPFSDRSRQRRPSANRGRYCEACRDSGRYGPVKASRHWADNHGPKIRSKRYPGGPKHIEP